MKIYKIGHCCLIIDTNNARIMTDPGAFTVDDHSTIAGVDIILITHEHADHLHTESLTHLIEKNPNVEVITNSSVGNILSEAGIKYSVLEGNGTKTIKNTPLEAFDEKHAEIYREVGQVQNTGYFIDNKLFYPGDAYCDPKKDVDILALPVAGPWCRIADAINYALKLKPNRAFPVHDGVLNQDRIGAYHRIPSNVLRENGVEFIQMKKGDTSEF